MPGDNSQHKFDFAARSAWRQRENEQPERRPQDALDERNGEATDLNGAIGEFYGRKFPGQFDRSVKGPVVTVTKKAGGSALKIEVLANDKFKLSGGSGPGGFGADVAVNMSEVTEEEMMDTLEDWFDIAAV